MLASPFSFLRGSAVVMAWDLAHTPTTGIEVLMDGDAHLANFGLFGTVERDVVFDLNDFDESQPGPWEWDLKRLAVSFNVLARELGWGRRSRHSMVAACVSGYRAAVRRLEQRGALDLWYEFLYARRRRPGLRLDRVSRALLAGAGQIAARRSSDTLLARLAQRSEDGTWRFRRIPPIQFRLPKARREAVLAGLLPYVETLPRGRRYLWDRYHAVDVAEHVVGVGSVGARAYVVLLFGNGEDDPLLLQVKEAFAPAGAPYLRPLAPDLARAPGKRVISAQLALHSSPDLLLGWTEIDGHSFYVRQMRNLKGSVPLDALAPDQVLRYAHACGEVLGHAHARTGDGAQIAGYCGRSGVLDSAIAAFAEAYGAQVVDDHRRLVRAVAAGRVRATVESPETTSPPTGGTGSRRRRPTSRRSSRRGPGTRPRPGRSPGTR